MNFVGNPRNKVLAFALVIFTSVNLFSQQLEFEDMLQRVDTIENPVYMPMISVGYGALNFMGDVKNSFNVPGIGNPAIRLNISTFIDNRHYIALNFNFYTGTLTGNQRSTNDIEKNLNFASNIYSIGGSAMYKFGDFMPESLKIRPFISIGVEQLNFNTKGDLYYGNPNEKVFYYYWPDGTIRNLPPSEAGAALPLTRDYEYETDLRSYEKDNFNLGNYNTRTLGIPLEIGFVLQVSQRIYFKVGAEYHYTFSDYIDNVASKGTSVVGNRAKDTYLMTHASLQFDLFSQPKTKTVDLLFADVELDPMFYDDEDGDFVLDNADHCLGTPYGVVTDTLGCPLDDDQDGVPDYLDLEPGTQKGNWVDENGVTLTEEAFLRSLSRDPAMKRKDLDVYLALLKKRYTRLSIKTLPDQLRKLDMDEDGYISFDELLKVIDGYFDFTLDISIDDLRLITEFFFAQ